MKLEKTITTIFIVPVVKANREKLKENGFINGFIKDLGREIQYENAVYLLFKPTNKSKFRQFLNEEYERTSDLIDDYDYPGGYVVVVYNLNKEFTSDYELIKQGKYSKTSKKFQQIFPKIVKLMRNGLHRDEISLQYRIFNKTQDLKKYWEDILEVSFDDEMEYWQGWIEEKEILDINKLIKENV